MIQSLCQQRCFDGSLDDAFDGASEDASDGAVDGALDDAIHGAFEDALSDAVRASEATDASCVFFFFCQV